MLAWFTTLLNTLLGGAVRSLLLKLGVTPADPAHPIPEYLAGEILVILIIIVGAIILRSRLSVENPGKFQHTMEYVLAFTRNMADEVIGHGSRRYVALIGTLGIFVILCNLLGLIPSLSAPTASIQVTLGCAVVAFLYYHFQGVRERGFFGYLKKFAGTVAWIAFLVFPIEIFSNALRLLSLSVRLWANMMVGGLLEGIFTSLVPVFVPAVFMALHIFESLLQAYIFMILPAVYIALAVSEEH